MIYLLSLVSDLFFSVQIQNTAKALGWKFVNVESPAQIPGQPPLILRAESPAAAQAESLGHDFIAFLVEQRPSLIVVELNSTVLPWHDWIVAAKSSPATRRIPVIGFGSHVDLAERQRALQAGCDEVLAKGRFTSAMPELLVKYAAPSDSAEIANACAEGLSALAREGIALFNRGDYFEAHEVLEHAWNEDDGIGRELYRGILQVAVAYLQVKRRNYNGAIKMFLRLRQWLDPLPDVCRSVDVAGLRRDAAEVREVIEALGAERIAEFDLSTLKPVRLTH